MSRRGWVLFALMSVVWGVPYLMIKVAVAEVSAPMVVFARTAVGALVLLPPALRGGGLRGLLPHWRPLAAFAALEILGPWFLLADAERELTSSMTGLLVAAVPVAAVVVERLTGDAERIGPLRWLGLAVGLAGVAVLAWPELQGGSPLAIAEVLLTAVCYSIAPVIVARRLADVPSLPMTAVCLAGAASVYAVPAAATWPQALPSGRALAALAGLGLICTALAFLMFFALIREVGPARAVVITYVNPAVAVAVGVALLGEPFDVSLAVAFVLILVGCVLATGRSRTADPASTDPASADAAPVNTAATDTALAKAAPADPVSADPAAETPRPGGAPERPAVSEPR